MLFRAPPKAPERRAFGLRCQALGECVKNFECPVTRVMAVQGYRGARAESTQQWSSWQTWQVGLIICCFPLAQGLRLILFSSRREESLSMTFLDLFCQVDSVPTPVPGSPPGLLADRRVRLHGVPGARPQMGAGRHPETPGRASAHLPA